MSYMNFGETISPYGDSTTDLSKLYSEYLKDPRSTIESEEGVFYRIVTRTRYYRCGDNSWMVIAYIPEGTHSKTVIDENFISYTIGNFPHIKFQGAVPEWYQNLKVFTLTGVDNINEPGEYICYK